MRTLKNAALAVRAVSAVFATAALFAGMDAVRDLAVACTGDGAWSAILAGIENLTPDDFPASSLLKSCTARIPSRGGPNSHGCSWTAPIGLFR